MLKMGANDAGEHALSFSMHFGMFLSKSDWLRIFGVSVGVSHTSIYNGWFKVPVGTSNFCSTHFGGLKSSGKWAELLPLHLLLSWTSFWALWIKLQQSACVHVPYILSLHCDIMSRSPTLQLFGITSFWLQIRILLQILRRKSTHMSISVHWKSRYRFPSKTPVFYVVITLGWTFGPFRAYFPCTQSASNTLLFWCFHLCNSEFETVRSSVRFYHITEFLSQ